MAGEVTFAQLAVYFKLTGGRERTGRVPGIIFDPCPTCDLSGGALMGALSAVQLCGWLAKDPYFEILGASLLPPSVGFDF